MKEYPRRRNGDEYYTKSSNPFVVDADGKERYARDHKGNELYPNRKNNLFARNQHHEEFYARDSLGNETYPSVNGQSILIPGRLARFANGNQRYPTDAKGNEYYLKDSGVPYLLRQNDGSTYLARSRKGIPMIPWNSLRVSDDTPYICSKDAAGNCVYVHETDLPENLKMICNCLCQCVSQCPLMFLRHLIGLAA